MTHLPIDREVQRLAAEMREERRRTRNPRRWRPAITLGAIQRATGIDRSYIARIFNGHRRPSLVVSRKLSVLLGMTIEEFLQKIGWGFPNS